MIEDPLSGGSSSSSDTGLGGRVFGRSNSSGRASSSYSIGDGDLFSDCSGAEVSFLTVVK